MGWFLVSAAIALIGLFFLVVLAREVWRKLRRLLDEIDTAVARASQASLPPAERTDP